MIKISKQDAKRLLVSHHFTPTSLQGAFERLGSVQYDPLNPVGRNHDLVLQARVPGYLIDDWQELTYQKRFLYDFWDKQASLVLMEDYPMRRIYYDWHAPRWSEILNQYPKAVERVYNELRDRGPLSSTEFHFQEHNSHWEGTWYGPKLTKNVLRALWHTGQVHTSSRNKGKHVYDLAERVIPEHIYLSGDISPKECIHWLILLRHKALGLMRPNAGTEVWSLGLSPQECREHLNELLEENLLIPVDVDGATFHALPNFLHTIDDKTVTSQDMRFIAPLDQIMWDRPAVAHIFDFDYRWEVYKPVNQRRWGYYVLPVMFGNEFVARIDSRLSDGSWNIHKWYWENDAPSKEMLDAVEQAVCRFRHYLGATSLKLPRGMDKRTRDAFRSGFKVNNVF